MYHFVWADQREKQGYKCDVSLKRGIQMICTLENDVTIYIDTTKPLLIVGSNLLIILSLNLNLVIKCFLMGMGFLSHGGLGAWFLTDLGTENGSCTAEPKDYIYSVACEV